jgi:ubiquinone/menaquinone biosynthesis C-methylase UbiE
MQMPERIRVAVKHLMYGHTGRTSEGERVTTWLALRPGMKVADVGAGLGDFSISFARMVGANGAVYAVDTDPDLRSAVAERASELKLPQIHPVAASEDDPGIPEPVDLAFFSASFHHLPDQAVYFGRLARQLLPGGRVVILEKKPGLLSRFLGHATDPADVTAVMAKAGYKLTGRTDTVRWASVQSFEPAS